MLKVINSPMRWQNHVHGTFMITFQKRTKNCKVLQIFYFLKLSKLISYLIASMTFSSVNFSNENDEVFRRPFNLYSRKFSLIKSFDSSKVIFESPLIFVKNLLKALATSADSETDDLLMWSMIGSICKIGSMGSICY